MPNLILFVLLFLVACSRKEDLDKKMVQFIAKSTNIDTSLWEIKLMSKKVTTKTQKVEARQRCESFKIVYSLTLQEDCFEQKSFWEENLVVSNLMSLFKTPQDSVQCFTTKDMERNINQWQKEEYQKIGQKVCVNREHVLLGGDCIKEIEITKEMIDADFLKIKEQAQKDLAKKPKHAKGEELIKSTNLEVCHSEKGESIISQL